VALVTVRTKVLSLKSKAGTGRQTLNFEEGRVASPTQIVLVLDPMEQKPLVEMGVSWVEMGGNSNSLWQVITGVWVEIRNSSQ